MGLFEETNYSYQRPPNENESSHFFSLRKITNDRNEDIYKQCKKVFHQIPFNYVRDLCDVFIELTDNIYYHSGQSENSGWGYVHAQTYDNIQIALSDVGVGVYGSYQRRDKLKNRTEKKLVCDIFEESESSLNPPLGQGDQHRGVGLSQVKDFIMESGGELNMYTGKVFAKVDQNGVRVLSNDNIKTEGTWIEMILPTQ